MTKQIKIHIAIFLYIATLISMSLLAEALFASGVANAEEITLSWTHDTPELVDEYKVYKKIYPDGAAIQIWSGSDTQLIIQIENNIRFGYTVTACNQYGSSLPSQEVFYIGLNPPEIIKITGQPQKIVIEFEEE